ncbi:TonB-dependent receptor [Aliamphritea hakodatensis]|uniref:TonB-dependent receptor n=1 Tax=Aliamphritea hakodatensis TaxID=2895352 RepID=UPI0022FDAFBE|nr:TonB-dependent receptor [Aliamphritea hakodatensis]
MKYTFSDVGVSALAFAMLGAINTQANEQPVTGNTLIITGEHTDRTLQDTASSVIAFGKDDLKSAAGMLTSNDLLDRIPNIVTVEPGNDAPTVRGLDGTGPASGANAFFAGTRPRLNYQIDGRTLGFNESVFQSASLWDVEQVEVFRGPQSTQQGRNSIAGAIIVHTADPTFEWEGKVRAITGSRNTQVTSFAISGPLAEDVLAFRLAADRQTRETAVSFEPYAQEDDPDLYENKTVRGKLLFTPTDTLSSILTVGRNDGQAPQSEHVVTPYDERTAEFPNQPTFHTRNTYGILDTTWEVSDNLTTELNLSYTDFQTDRHALTGQGNLTINGDETVVQPMIRLQSDDGSLSGFAGAYIFSTEQKEVIDLFGGGEFRDETDSKALFGEVNLTLSDEYSLTLGGRYEEEERKRVGSAGPLALDYNETYREFLPKATLFWDFHDDWTAGLTAGKGYNGGGAGITFSAPFVAYTYKPEYVWNYEAFLRGTLLDGQLDVTANLFYNDFKDMQLPFYLGANSTVIRNADKATTYGAEAGLKYRFSPGNEVFANLGLLQTKVNNYSDASIEGNDLSRAPAFSLDLGFVTTPLPDFEISANVRHSDAYYSDATNTARGKIDAYTIANTQLAYRIRKNLRVHLAVNNLFDNDDPVLINTSLTSNSATIQNPRTITAGIEYNF